jgi:hypothetical protein
LDKEGRRGRPSGVTGVFYLEAIAPAVATTPLDGPWSAASDVGVVVPMKKGGKVACAYLETRFTLPAKRPGRRLFLERAGGEPIMALILNNRMVIVSMPRIDISGLVDQDGENVLRWAPHRILEITNRQPLAIPELNLVWTE